MSNSDYILVKDKDGNLKYYKDGKYFDIEEIDNPKPSKDVSSIDPAKVDQGKKTRTLHDIDLSEEKDDELEKFSHLDENKKKIDENVRQAIEAIVKDLKVNFTDKNIKKRFENLLASRLRDVRNDKEVKYMLCVPKGDGGLGLDDKKADLVLAVTKKHLINTQEKNKEVVKSTKMPEKGTLYENKRGNQLPNSNESKKVINTVDTVNKESGAREPKSDTSVVKATGSNLAEYKVKKNSASPKQKETSDKVVPKKDLSKKEPLSKNTSQEVKAPEKKDEDKKGKQLIDDLIAREGGGFSLDKLVPKKEASPDENLKPNLAQEDPQPEPPKPKAQPLRQSVPQKNQTSDVSYSPKLYSPLDEIKTLDLENFRRLGNDIKEILDEVEEKIENLREESFNQGIKALQAWKECPVFLLYKDIGLQSILTGQSVADVIVDRQVKNEASLTQSEFDGILNFNQKMEI